MLSTHGGNCRTDDHFQFDSVRGMRGKWLKIVSKANWRWTNCGRGVVTWCQFLWAVTAEVQCIVGSGFHRRRRLFAIEMRGAYDLLFQIQGEFAVTDDSLKGGQCMGLLRPSARLSALQAKPTLETSLLLNCLRAAVTSSMHFFSNVRGPFDIMSTMNLESVKAKVVRDDSTSSVVPLWVSWPDWSYWQMQLPQLPFQIVWCEANWNT